MYERRYSNAVEKLRDPQRVERLEVERVIELSLAGHTLQSVLDVGTGSGLFAEVFAGRGLTIAGLDIREEMLEAARQFVPMGDFRSGNMGSLPFADGAFDLVFMGLVLHEADDLSIALREAHRIARQRLAVLEWTYEAGEFGPPLEHRLSSEHVLSAAHEVGFAGVEPAVLKHLTLFRFEKPVIQHE